jgi:hypothetical protein
MANVAQQIVKVRAHWDNQDPNNEGWYAMAYARGTDGDLYEYDDSMKVWFPIKVDDFSQEQSAELLAALSLAFDGAEIEVQS